MYQLKTKPTEINPFHVINAIPNEKKQADAKILLELFQNATGKPPVVWGEKFIGYGTYRYKYPTGHSGEIYATGFSVTKSRITLHLYLEEPLLQNYLQKLGKATSGKSCVYINKLADIDTAVLEELIHLALNCADTLSEKDTGVFSEYLAQIEPPQHRDRTQEVLCWAERSFPVLESKIAWNQPMFTDHGTFIIGFNVSAKHLAISPERQGMEHFTEEIAKAGYEQSKMLFRIKWEEAVDYELLHRIIDFNRLEKADCQTFWRK